MFPISPLGNSFPLSSTTRTSIPGNANPADPGLGFSAGNEFDIAIAVIGEPLSVDYWLDFSTRTIEPPLANLRTQ